MVLQTFFRDSRFRSILIGLLFGCSQLQLGCLQTRSSVKEAEEKQVLKSTVANLQKSSADVNSRFQDIEDDLRKLSGRIEVIETGLRQIQNKSDKGNSIVETKMKENETIYREEFSKLTTEIDQLKAQLAALQSSLSADAVKEESDAAKGPFALAEDKFEKKEWKDAILDYERYRKSNPKGKQFAEATYKIGVSFQELGMTDEAKAFYEEVLAKFPKSKQAGRASSRLKNIKKK